MKSFIAAAGGNCVAVHRLLGAELDVIVNVAERSNVAEDYDVACGVLDVAKVVGAVEAVGVVDADIADVVVDVDVVNVDVRGVDVDVFDVDVLGVGGSMVLDVESKEANGRQPSLKRVV